MDRQFDKEIPEVIRVKFSVQPKCCGLLDQVSFILLSVSRTPV
jgi:hypothetical protein